MEAESSLEPVPTPALLGRYAAILSELRRRGVVDAPTATWPLYQSIAASLATVGVRLFVPPVWPGLWARFAPSAPD